MLEAEQLGCDGLMTFIVHTGDCYAFIVVVVWVAELWCHTAAFIIATVDTIIVSGIVTGMNIRSMGNLGVINI